MMTALTTGTRKAPAAGFFMMSLSVLVQDATFFSQSACVFCFLLFDMPARVHEAGRARLSGTQARARSTPALAVGPFYGRAQSASSSALPRLRPLAPGATSPRLVTAEAHIPISARLS